MKEEIKSWIEFASEDLKMAELALEEGIYNQTCFHSEQCVEKTIKALIIHRDFIYPKSHKLADLLSLLPETFKDLKEKILLLDRFYIPTRYPDALPGALPEGLPTAKDSEEAIEIAREVFEKVKNMVEK
ncbi:MAG: HEPN domain-containing protein [bacterium]